MKLKEIGEFGFINRFAHRFDPLINSKDTGIGDDCALLSINDKEYHLVSTDLLIEDVHFLKDEISPEELGHKSLAVNLSDIAAMGGKPLYSFLSIAIPKSTELEYLDRFMEGYHKLSEQYNTPLMGGDTTSSDDKLIINVTIIGSSTKQDARLRSMAKTGDVICVTGPLGNSAGGLKILLDKLSLNTEKKKLIKRHHTPEPRINEGLWLAKQNGIHAMMDISDGIASDLKHILKASEKGATIYLENIPTSQTLKHVSSEEKWDIDTLSTSGGEDYELLITINSEDAKTIIEEFEYEFKTSLYPIGIINDNKNEINWTKEGKEIRLEKRGFNHFKQ